MQTVLDDPGHCTQSVSPLGQEQSHATDGGGDGGRDGGVSGGDGGEGGGGGGRGKLLQAVQMLLRLSAKMEQPSRYCRDSRGWGEVEGWLAKVDG